MIDHGRVVHDGSIEALHARYGSRRRVVVELDEPVQSPPSAATGGSGLAGGGTVLPAATVEPDIEDVVAWLYAAPDR